MNNDRPRCVGCRRVLSPQEQDLARLACFPCEDGVKEHLNALAGPDGLFAQLVWKGTDALTPGSRRSSSDPVVKTSKVTAPSPVNLGAANLLGAGGVVQTLQRWVKTWYVELGFREPVWRGQLHYVVLVAPGGERVRRPGQLDNTVKVLLNNMPWACEHRGDFGEFRHEVRKFVEDAEMAVDPTKEKRTRMQIGRCPADVDGLTCGHLLDADPYALAIRCPNCGTKWPRNQWVDLAQAVRKG